MPISLVEGNIVSGLTLDPARSVSILGVQCSCSWVESRDRACVSEPPTRWKPDRSLSPADIWTTLISRGVSRPAQCVDANALSASEHREAITALPNFSDLGLSAPILGALAAEGYAAPTPIQFQAIPPVLGGRDLGATAQPPPGMPPSSGLRTLQRLAAVPQGAAHQPAALSCWLRRGSWRARL